MDLLKNYSIDEKNFIGIFDLDLDKCDEYLNNIIDYWNVSADNVLKNNNKDNLSIGSYDIYKSPFDSEDNLTRKDKQLFLSSLDSPSLVGTEEFYVAGSQVTFYNAITSECFKLFQKTFTILTTTNWTQFNVKLQVTPPSGGFHNWHFENGNLEVSRRILTTMLYLNDNYDYGETEFLYQGIRIQPKKGRFCIFPASFTHTHRGNPPTNGTKIILTSWIEIL